MAKYFTIKEMCASNTAKALKIDNTPTKEIEEHLYELMDVLDDIREGWGSGIRVNSGYRCPKLNAAVKGSKTSVHKIGYAADLYPVNGDFECFRQFMLEWAKTHMFDQLLIERSAYSQWIHIGLRNNAGGQRRQIKNLKV